MARKVEPLVRCDGLAVRFVGREDTVYAVNGVSFDLSYIPSYNIDLQSQPP